MRRSVAREAQDSAIGLTIGIHKAALKYMTFGLIDTFSKTKTSEASIFHWAMSNKGRSAIEELADKAAEKVAEVFGEPVMPDGKDLGTSTPKMGGEDKTKADALVSTGMYVTDEELVKILADLRRGEVLDQHHYARDENAYQTSKAIEGAKKPDEPEVDSDDQSLTSEVLDLVADVLNGPPDTDDPEKGPVDRANPAETKALAGLFNEVLGDRGIAPTSIRVVVDFPDKGHAASAEVAPVSPAPAPSAADPPQPTVSADPPQPAPAPVVEPTQPAPAGHENPKVAEIANATRAALEINGTSTVKGRAGGAVTPAQTPDKAAKEAAQKRAEEAKRGGGPSLTDKRAGAGK